MSDSQFVKEKGQSTNKVKLYEVALVADAQVSLTGAVNVYAVDDDEAIAKVKAQIDAETLDDDLEMNDSDSNMTLTYDYVKHCSNVEFQIDHVEVVEDDVDPADVLEAEVEQLQANISWNTEALAKHKAFLESLLVA